MFRKDRRAFIEDSMLATAGAALAAITVQNSANADDKQSTSANERLRVAVIGVNGRGKEHISSFLGRKDTEIVCICDPDEKVGKTRVDEIAKKTGKAPKYAKDLRQVMDDKAVDLVSIATPNHWHALAAIWALQAGKDVYVEKPVSHNVSEGRRIVEAARKYNRICQTGTQSRSSSAIKEAFEYVRSGKLGKLELARGLCYKRRDTIHKSEGPTEPPKHIDYNLWTGPAPLVPLMRKKLHYDWHWVWDTGNGDLGNQGIHQMDICRWALGVQTLAKSVFTIGGRFGYVDDGQTPNTELSFFDFGAAQPYFEVRGLKTEPYKGAPNGVGNIIHCANGYVAIGSGYGKAAAFDNDGKQVAAFSGSDNHFGNFIKAVRSRKVSDLNADIEEGHLSSALCHLGNISYRLGRDGTIAEAIGATGNNALAKEALERTGKHLADNGLQVNELSVRIGKALEFDPKTETFVSDTQANQMLSREYRSPFEVPAAGKV